MINIRKWLLYFFIYFNMSIRYYSLNNYIHKKFRIIKILRANKHIPAIIFLEIIILKGVRSFSPSTESSTDGNLYFFKLCFWKGFDCSLPLTFHWIFHRWKFIFFEIISLKGVRLFSLFHRWKFKFLEIIISKGCDHSLPSLNLPPLKSLKNCLRLEKIDAAYDGATICNL